MKLRDFKIAQGFSAKELSAFLATPVPTVKAWLADTRLPRRAELIMIYKRTHGQVTPNDFVLPDDPDPPPEEEEDEPPLLDYIQKTAAG